MMRNRLSLNQKCVLVVAAIALAKCGCGGGPPRPVIIVSLSSTNATVQVDATMQFSANVEGDPSSAGVTWTVTCSTSSCGSVLPTSSVSATYTAPASPPASNLNVTLTATSVTDATKSAAALIIVPSVVVDVTPSSASVVADGNAPFTATVTHDSQNAGVSWTVVYGYVKCFIGAAGLHCGSLASYVSCGSGCGTVSSAATASGTSTTYTAPAQVMPPALNCTCRGVGIFIQATSVADTSAFSLAQITIPPISVAVSPTSASVPLNGTQQFTSTVTNDGSNSGVTWSLTQNGAACSPACGTIAPTTTVSGATAIYTPPASAPAFPLATVTATSVVDTTKSTSATVTLTTSTGSLACGAGSGSESLVKGQYAFLLYGFDQAPPMFGGGSFTADGTGKITGGEEDIQANGPTGTDVNINAGGSAYAVGPDHRGCLVLANANSTSLFFRFALGSINSSSIATTGHIIEFSDTTGKGTRSAGSIRLQDATSFSGSQFKGKYAFGLAWIGGNGAMAGTFSADGISAITSNTIDADFGGTLTSNVTSTPGGSFTCCSANGRGTLQLDNSSLGLGTFAIYMINSSDVLLVSDIVDGEAIGIPAGTVFTQAFLSGVSVLRDSAQSSAGPIVDIATVSADGKGAITANENINKAGTFTTNSTALNYVVASNGRVTLSGETTAPVLYLYGANQGFLVGTDPSATFGFLEPRAAGPFSNASFSGAYAFGVESPLASTVTIESGVLTADGNGNATGTSDQSSGTGLTQNQSFNFTYAFPANGVGNVGSNTTAILISGNKLVFISNTSPNPTITVLEQ